MLDLSSRPRRRRTSRPRRRRRVGIDWQLAPVEFIWFGKSGVEICTQMKDPKRNGGRDAAGLVEHLRHDASLNGFIPRRWAPGAEPIDAAGNVRGSREGQWPTAGAAGQPVERRRSLSSLRAERKQSGLSRRRWSGFHRCARRRCGGSWAVLTRPGSTPRRGAERVAGDRGRKKPKWPILLARRCRTASPPRPPADRREARAEHLDRAIAPPRDHRRRTARGSRPCTWQVLQRRQLRIEEMAGLRTPRPIAGTRPAAGLALYAGASRAHSRARTTGTPTTFISAKSRTISAATASASRSRITRPRTACARFRYCWRSGQAPRPPPRSSRYMRLSGRS